MKSASLKYVGLKSILFLCLLSGTQQALTAFGTYALIRAGLVIGLGQAFLFWTVLALISFLISPWINYLIRPLETDLTFSAYKKYLEMKLISKARMPSIWMQKEKRETYLASIGTEAEAYLAALIFVVFDMLTYVLGLVLGVLVLGFAIDSKFIPAFLLSGGLSFFIYKKLEGKAAGKSECEQTARTDLGSYLLLSWENIFFKNETVVKRYQIGVEKRLEEAQIKAVESARWNAGFVGALGFVTMLPVFGVVIYYALLNLDSAAALTAMLVTIPRQMNLLNTFNQLFQSATSYIAFEAKFKKMDESSALIEVPVLSRVCFEELSVQGLSEISVDALARAQSGRFTLRGKNGAGKSTLLLHLNETLKSSFYLPANPQFEFRDANHHESTGEKLLRHLDFIRESDATHILMDEWDANLDATHLRMVHDFIEEMSLKKVVIEVRHRG